MRKMRIWTCYFTRSELGPLGPLLNELSFRDDVEVHCEYISRKMPIDSIMYSMGEFDPDLVLCGFDRPEMVPIAYAVYHKGIPIAQIFAGDLAGGAYDDADRFVLSNYATMLFCATTASKRRIIGASRWRDEMFDDKRVHLVGATHFDDMKDNGQPGDVCCPFDLVLYNPPSMASEGQIDAELEKIKSYLRKDRSVVWVEPNGDEHSNKVKNFVMKLEGQAMWKKNMARPHFLSYMRFCDRMIGNSSCMAYEAAYYGKVTVQIGMRNRFRERMPDEKCKPGASKRIADLMIDFCKERFYNGERDE
jgi:UDP-N-acetylglucosamine 2-epimerase (hydrolysing)